MNKEKLLEVERKQNEGNVLLVGKEASSDDNNMILDTFSTLILHESSN